MTNTSLVWPARYQIFSCRTKLACLSLGCSRSSKLGAFFRTPETQNSRMNGSAATCSSVMSSGHCSSSAVAGTSGQCQPSLDSGVPRGIAASFSLLCRPLRFGSGIAHGTAEPGCGGWIARPLRTGLLAAMVLDTRCCCAWACISAVGMKRPGRRVGALPGGGGPVGLCGDLMGEPGMARTCRGGGEVGGIGGARGGGGVGGRGARCGLHGGGGEGKWRTPGWCAGDIGEAQGLKLGPKAGRCMPR